MAAMLSPQTQVSTPTHNARAEAVQCLFQQWPFSDQTNIKQVTIDCNGVGQVADYHSSTGLVSDSCQHHATVSQSAQNQPSGCFRTHLLLSKGSGLGADALQINKNDFADICEKWEIAPELLKKAAHHCKDPDLHFFEYHLNSSSTGLTAVNLGIRWFLHTEVYMFCLCQYNVQQCTFNVVFFEDGVIQEDQFANQLDDRLKDIMANPLRLIGILLELCEIPTRAYFSILSHGLLQTEAMLGVAKISWHTTHGFPEESNNYTQINASLYSSQINIGTCYARCTTLQYFGKEL